jgi:crossover junction endodeoxyribonuclease RusA
MIEFFVPGAPVPGGSKKAFPVRGRDGKLHVSVADTSGPRGQEWRAAIRLAAGRIADDPARKWQPGAVVALPYVGALRLSLWFYLLRPRSHFGKRGLCPGAPAFPTTRPDVLKLARAVEDACSGIVWTDDAQIVTEDLCKLYADGGASIGVRVRVEQLDARQAGAARALGRP